MTPEWPEASGQDQLYILRLLVSGSSPRSTRAIENLKRVLDLELAGRYDLEVIDIYQNPEAARLYQVVAAPTLVKLEPSPARRVIGDLSDEARVRSGLGLAADPTGDGDA